MAGCPNCELDLLPAVEHGESLRQCAQCLGHFVPHETMRRLIQHAARPIQENQRRSHRPRNPASRAVKYMRCPDCDKLMDRRNFGKVSGVIVNKCVHGVWLDSGDLRCVLVFLEEGGLERAEKFDAEEHDRLRQSALLQAVLDTFGYKWE